MPAPPSGLHVVLYSAPGVRSFTVNVSASLTRTPRYWADVLLAATSLPCTATGAGSAWPDEIRLYAVGSIWTWPLYDEMAPVMST
jgi:hypothetical protein